MKTDAIAMAIVADPKNAEPKAMLSKFALDRTAIDDITRAKNRK